MKTPTYIGIDPGLSGAVCIYSPANFLSVIDIETRDIQGCDGSTIKREVDSVLLNSRIVEQLRENDLECIVMHMERVQGRGGNSAQSTFSLGDSMGAIRSTVAIAAKPQHELYSLPSVWKNNLDLSSDKRKSIDLAIKLEPKMAEYLTHAKHHDRSEAFLLAWMAAKIYENMC